MGVGKARGGRIEIEGVVSKAPSPESVDFIVYASALGRSARYRCAVHAERDLFT